MEWLESECDSFLTAHSQFGDSCELATKLKDEHNKFLERIEPTCAKTERVVESLEKLRPQAPPLASSIDRLCQAVSERIKDRKALVRKRSSVLSIFIEFCSLYQQVSVHVWSCDCDDGLLIHVHVYAHIHVWSCNYDDGMLIVCSSMLMVM